MFFLAEFARESPFSLTRQFQENRVNT
jgi:hypothetical protein